jgi:hypothetical protein
MNQKAILGILGVVAAVSVAYGINSVRQDKHYINYDYVLSSLNPQRPGFGFETNESGPMELPMAYGLIASAGAIRGDIETAKKASNWLLGNIACETRPGWGLGWAWDAFADGSTNPEDTVYGVTTAIAVDGLMRTFRLTGDTRYLRSSVQALNYYKTFHRRSEEGSIVFLYSDQLNDSFYEVNNVTAMLMGQYAHVWYFAADHPEINCNDFEQIAKSAFKSLEIGMVLDDSHTYWKYGKGLNHERANDLVHAAYIVYGLYKFSKYIDKDEVVLRQAMKYLRGFLTDNNVLEFHPNHAPKGYESASARSWGVGMILFLCALLDEHKMYEDILNVLPDYEFQKYHFSYRHGDKLHTPRAVAHLLLGLATDSRRTDLLAENKRTETDN